MKKLLLTVVWCLFGSILMGDTGVSAQVLLNKTDFNNGGFAGWESFTTSNGTLGGGEFPKIVSFETIGQDHLSRSVQFKVGKVHFNTDHEPPQGGGLVTRIVTESGKLDLSVNLAVSYHSPKDKRNLAGGLFQWIVDDQVIANWDVGPIENNEVIRQTLEGHHQVKKGTHTIRFRITRPFISGERQQAPFQMVDDIMIQFSSSP